MRNLLGVSAPYFHVYFATDDKNSGDDRINVVLKDMYPDPDSEQARRLREIRVAGARLPRPQFELDISPDSDENAKLAFSALVASAISAFNLWMIIRLGQQPPPARDEVIQHARATFDVVHGVIRSDHYRAEFDRYIDEIALPMASAIFDKWNEP